MRRKHQKSEVNYRPKEPAGPCLACGTLSWIRTLPKGEWVCEHCCPYKALDARAGGNYETRPAQPAPDEPRGDR